MAWQTVKDNTVTDVSIRPTSWTRGRLPVHRSFQARRALHMTVHAALDLSTDVWDMENIEKWYFIPETLGARWRAAFASLTPVHAIYEKGACTLVDLRRTHVLYAVS